MKRREFLASVGLTAAAMPGVSYAFGSKPMVLVEAEGFQKRGGWVLDQQFMDQMGSPYLLAHGLGKPVEDAVATAEFSKSGKYKIWVRTRDWVGPWKLADTPATKLAKGSPGIFKLMVNGKDVGVTFGEEGAEWHWQDGGIIEIEKGKAEVKLHDLTGFEGRCDAVLFCMDEGFVPPNEGEKMAKFRREVRGMSEKPADAGKYDLVVVGGGFGGLGAAVSGARQGLTVAFIQDRPVLGGNNSSEVRVWLNGNSMGPRYPAVGAVTRALETKKRAHDSTADDSDFYEDEKREAFVREHENITLFLNHRMNGVEMKGNTIKAVIAQDIETGERKSFGGRYFADCTGDGCVGAEAGADFEMSVKEHMGHSNLWKLRDTGKPVKFQRCPWAYDLSNVKFPGHDGKNPGRQLGTWFWESGCYTHPIRDRERARDNNFRAMYGAWDSIKNVKGALGNYELRWAAYITGPRESRRLLGDVILSKEHLMKGDAEFDDACVITGWHIDLHLPRPNLAKGFEGDEFITHAIFTKYKMPFYVPYRCFYSRNIDNLFMAGRNVSVTRDGLGAVRVMRTCGLMGEVVGMAASICVQHGTTPRGVYKEHLDELKELMRGDGEVPAETTSDMKFGTVEESNRTSSTDKYKITEIPDKLKGMKCVTVPRGSMHAPGAGYEFKISEKADVYIAVHDRGECIPKSWKKTDMKLKWDSHTDTVYCRTFEAGKVTVPSHTGKAGNYFGLPNMSFVDGKVKLSQMAH